MAVYFRLERKLARTEDACIVLWGRAVCQLPVRLGKLFTTTCKIWAPRLQKHHPVKWARSIVFIYDFLFRSQSTGIGLKTSIGNLLRLHVNIWYASWDQSCVWRGRNTGGKGTDAPQSVNACVVWGRQGRGTSCDKRCKHAARLAGIAHYFGADYAQAPSVEWKQLLFRLENKMFPLYAVVIAGNESAIQN